MRRLTFLFLIAYFSLACSPKLKNKHTPLKDTDGNNYTLQVMSDGKLWTTQNLNTRIEGSFCYGDTVSHCEKYGRLYTWESAKEVCQRLGREWRLPTNEEWEEMVQHYGGIRMDSRQDGKEAYNRLIQGGDSQFNIVFGGGRDPSGEYRRLGAHGFYWTATAYDSANAWFYNLGKNGKIVNRHNDGEKSWAMSVRCVKD